MSSLIDDDSENALNDGENDINNSENKINNGENALNDGKNDINNSENKVEDNSGDFSKPINDANSQTISKKTILPKKTKKIKKLKLKFNTGIFNQMLASKKGKFRESFEAKEYNLMLREE